VERIERLVEGRARRWGRLPVRPRSVNPLDEYTGVFRSMRGWRLKQWVGFTLIHPELHASMIIQDAAYLASSQIYTAEAGVLTQHARNAAGGSLRPPEVLLDGGQVAVRKPGYVLTYDFAADSHTIKIEIDESADAAAIRGTLILDVTSASAPLVVSAHLPPPHSDAKMFTYKAILPVYGTLTVGERSYSFDAARDLAIIDEHKSFFPYRTRWLWGTFAMLTDDGPVGANLCSRAELPGEPEECCLWTPGAAEPLADVSFDPRPDGTWAIASTDGRIEVTFTPKGRKLVKHQLGLASIDYFQLYGSYRGVLRGQRRAYDITDVPGVCESMKARF